MTGTSGNPRALAGARPFDGAFVDAITARHKSASVVLKESRNPKIRGIVQDIFSAQERGISQMKEWCERW